MGKRSTGRGVLSCERHPREGRRAGDAEAAKAGVDGGRGGDGEVEVPAESVWEDVL